MVLNLYHGCEESRQTALSSKAHSLEFAVIHLLTYIFHFISKDDPQFMKLLAVYGNVLHSI